MGDLNAPHADAAATLARELADAHQLLADLQELVAEQQAAAGRVIHGGLVHLDLTRTLVGLDNARFALRRAQRHTDLLTGHDTGHDAG